MYHNIRPDKHFFEEFSIFLFRRPRGALRKTGKNYQDDLQNQEEQWFSDKPRSEFVHFSGWDNPSRNIG
jgi:hypothetical protein